MSIGAEANEASHSMILNSACVADVVSILEVSLAVVRLDKGVLPHDVGSRYVQLRQVVAVAFV
jgi:hypothetical protein